MLARQAGLSPASVAPAWRPKVTRLKLALLELRVIWKVVVQQSAPFRAALYNVSLLSSTFIV